MTLKMIIPIFLVSLAHPYMDGKDLVKKMHARYAGKWYRSFTFDQTTQFYRNDSLKGEQTWYEALVFPDKFRIDFGEPDSGNAVIYKGDSAYNFRKGKLRSVRKDENDLTFLLGGMYFFTLDQALQKLKALGYDLDKLHEDSWKGKPVFVLGAGKGELNINQLWIDRDNLYLVRMVKFEGGRKEEAIFDNHQLLGGGWTETKCDFYFNDKLVQVETYHNCKANVPLDERLFDPTFFGQGH
ncbi:MAG TPA: hypothetical protein VE035_06425 [Puia sp.]|nr:hypothetical protein [Puia sp.]